MGKSFTFEHREVINKLNRLSSNIEKDGQKAVNDTADFLLNKAKQTIQAKNHIDTKRLLNSIYASYKNGKTSHSYSCLKSGVKTGRRPAITSFSESIGTPEELEALIGTAVPYAIYVHNITPFMKIALESSKAEFKRNIARII